MSIKDRAIEQKYFHCYATANDRSLYLRDIQNLIRIKNCYSGFSKVVLFIAISEVKKISLFDRFFVRMIKKMFHKHPSIVVMEVYFKSNIGRDFSSFQSLFLKVKQIAGVNDFILFQNRSGYGPFQKNWYSQFVKQFEKFDSIALCGSTINFMDHDKRSLSDNLPHVQTYSFLTKVFYLNMLKDSFPGSNETEQIDIVCKGEIALSQFFLEKKYKITCIEWPNEEISNQSAAIVSSDIKGNVTARHYFYHRTYFKKNLAIKINQIKNDLFTWFIFLYHVYKK